MESKIKLFEKAREYYIANVCHECKTYFDCLMDSFPRLEWLNEHIDYWSQKKVWYGEGCFVSEDKNE